MQRHLAWLGIGILSALTLGSSLTTLAAQSQVAQSQVAQSQVAQSQVAQSQSQLPASPSANPGNLSNPVSGVSGIDALPSLSSPSLPSLTEPSVPHRGGRWRDRSRSTPHSPTHPLPPATPGTPGVLGEPEGTAVEPSPPSTAPDDLNLDLPRSPRFTPRRFPPENPIVLGSGNFTSTGHLIQGRVTLVTSRGESTIRFSPSFMTDGASNSRIAVVLHREAAPRSLEDPDDYVTIGDLRQFNGAHDYGIPPTIDPTEYRSIVIWNPRSRVTYGYASFQ